MKKKKRIERAQVLLAEFGLEKAADRKFGGYSKGMKRKLTIAAGIIHEPFILFLDEPTTGIDVASARQIRQLIDDLHRDGTTIMLTTHYIEEAERLCGRIAFIVDGHIVRIDTIESLMQPVQGNNVLRFTLGTLSHDIENELLEAFPVTNVAVMSGNELRVESQEKLSLAPLVDFFDKRGITVTEARLLRPTLEDVFVKVTGIETSTMKREKEKKGGNA